MIRITLPSRLPWLVGALVVGLLVTACSSPEPFSRSTGRSGFTDAAIESEPLASRMDRSDWMVATRSKIWKVYENPDTQGGRHIGFLVGSKYRQMRGGPQFRMYKVTTLDRNDQIGHIDQMGRAVRYEPRRDGQFVEIPVGASSLNENVTAIFDIRSSVRLEETSKVRLAFEALDDDGDGHLNQAETAEWGGRLAQADKDRDGFVDYDEFQNLDR